MTYPLIHAANYTPANRPRLDLVVLHSIECACARGVARNVATRFSTEQAPQASFHYAVDPGEVVQSVLEPEVAWHADHHDTNWRSVGIEHAGRAAFTQEEWQSEDGLAMLRLSVQLCAGILKRWGIPALVMDARALIGTPQARGITTHAEVTKAFHTPGGHWDPGSGFPLSWYAERVAAEMEVE